MRRTGPAPTSLDEDSVARGFRAAIGEAWRYVGATAPNPPVGCAILDGDGAFLAVAAHQRAGEAHAEALALRLCRERGTIGRAATAIVTLEPCNHTGRTPPCTEAILASPVRTVWIGAADPNPLVAGGGETMLRAAGLAVHRPPPDGDVARDCAALIAPFAQLSCGLRPWITVKQALDPSGSMIPPVGSRTFTGRHSLLLAHRLRRCTDAIITGVGTIRADAPHFTVRHVPDHPGRRRILAVMDRGGGVPEAYARAAEERGLALRTAPDPGLLMQLLASEGVLWAMVEAGPRLLRRLQAEALWDDWLTIRQDGRAQDHVEWRSRRSTTPLRLIGQDRDGTSCSVAS